MISKKIVLVGDFSTGKTSLIRRFVDNSFSDRYLSTMGVKVSTKTIETDAGAVRGLIWDIEGGTETQPMNETYLLGAHGGIVVADITREESMEHLGDYIGKARKRAPNIVLVVALNKIDLVDEKRAQTYLDRLRGELEGVDALFLTSAKTGEGVERMFTALAETMLQR